MALLGFITTNGVEFTPDKSATISNTPKLAKAVFGDGYEQRARKGINSMQTTYSVTFSNRTLSEAQELSRFFDEVLGVSAFNFTLPGDALDDYRTTSVVCDDYSRTMDYNNYHTITATFRRVYN